MSTFKNFQQPLSDEEIVTLLLSKDMKGVSALYDKYGSYLLGLSQEIVKVEYFSEIALQNAFLKVWKNISSYNLNKGRFFTWVIQITRNASIDVIRSKQYKQSNKLINLDTARSVAVNTDFEIQIENIDIKDIVAKLDGKYKALIELVYFQGFTHKEVAEELGIPLGTVKSRIKKAFHELRDILK